jgi:hypothetical protein
LSLLVTCWVEGSMSRVLFICPLTQQVGVCLAPVMMEMKMQTHGHVRSVSQLVWGPGLGLRARGEGSQSVTRTEFAHEGQSAALPHCLLKHLFSNSPPALTSQWPPSSMRPPGHGWILGASLLFHTILKSVSQTPHAKVELYILVTPCLPHVRQHHIHPGSQEDS